jgi:hypothetical protein
MHTDVCFDAEAGREELARGRLGADVDRFADQTCAPTTFWPVAAFRLASTAVELGRRDEAEALHAVLAPHAQRHCVYTGLMFFGAYELHLGSLAALLGRREERIGDPRAAALRARAEREATAFGLRALPRTLRAP